MAPAAAAVVTGFKGATGVAKVRIGNSVSNLCIGVEPVVTAVEAIA